MFYRLRRRLLSQNFLSNRTLINFLVRNSSIGLNDTVLEIGPGKGFITTELLKRSKKVIAVELDEKLVLHLRQFLGNYPNFELHQADFLKFPLPDFPYKVFANIPFSIEGEILRKLLDSCDPPEDCYLVVDKRFALRLSGSVGENQFSLKHKPWFDFSLYHEFKKSDFTPEPKVDGVMWRIRKKEKPLLPSEKRKSWEKFIEVGFGHGQTMRQNLKNILSPTKMQSLSSKLNFSLKDKPGRLSLDQWLRLYLALGAEIPRWQ